jgi:hypothetical protein
MRPLQHPVSRGTPAVLGPHVDEQRAQHCRGVCGPAGVFGPAGVC